jgi:hypothetical protein
MRMLDPLSGSARSIELNGSAKSLGRKCVAGGD